MIYVDFERILVLEDNTKKNLDECCTNKYQKHVACSYGYKLVCVDDKFSKLFNLYLDCTADVVCNIVKKMPGESKYYSDEMANHF